MQTLSYCGLSLMHEIVACKPEPHYMLMMLALGPDSGRTVAADAPDVRFGGRACEGQSQLMLMMLALGLDSGRTVAADAPDARFGGRACAGQSQLMLMMLALVAQLQKDNRS